MSHRKRAVLLAALQIMAIFTLVSLLPMTPVMGEAVPSQINGNWIIPVNTSIEYWGGTANVTGNIFIESGATLTLHKSTIKLNPPWEGETGIYVRGTGTLKMDGVRFMSGNGVRYEFVFEQSSNGVIENSNISDAGYGWTFFGAGIYIQSSSVTLEGNDIHDGALGIFVEEGASPKIINNTIRDNDLDGMFVLNSAAEIKGNLIKDNNQMGDGMFQGYGGATISMRATVFEDNILLNNNIANLHIVDINNMEIRNCYFNNTGSKDIRVDGLFRITTLKVYNSNFTTVQMNRLWQDYGEPNGARAMLTPYWTADVHVTMESTGASVPDATVGVRTMDGTSIVTGIQTDEGGMVSDLDVPEYEMRNNGTATSSTFTTDYKPHVVWATVDVDGTTLSSNTTIIIDREDMLIEVVIDDIAPFLDIESPADGNVTDQTYVEVMGRTEPTASLTINTNDVPLNPDGSFISDVTLSEGNNQISVIATDPSGNPTEKVVNVRKDTIAPIVTIHSPENGTATGNPYPYITGSTEYGSDLWVNDKIVQVQPDGTFNTTIRLAEGENTIRAVAKDVVGNTGVHEITVFMDSIPPVLNIVEPIDGKKTNEPTIIIMGVAEMGSTLMINNQRVMFSGSTFKYSHTLVEGENLVLVTAMDANGNMATATVTIILDTEPPTVEITFPPEGYETNKDAVIVTGLTEAGATVRLNGVSLDNVGGVFSGEAKLEASQNKMTILVTDEMGNTASKDIRVFKDIIPPDLMVQNPKDGEVLNKKSSGKVDVRGTTEKGATVYVNGERAGVSGTTFQLWVYLGDGNNSIEVSAHDPAGNVWTERLSVVYDGHVEYQILTPIDGLTTGVTVVDATGFVEPGGSVIINGEAASVNEMGGFSFDVDLKAGKNTVTFVLSDTAGNEETVTRYVTKDTAGMRASASSQSLSILFIVLIVVLIVVMTAFIMRGRRPKPQPIEIVTDVPPPPPEIYQSQYGDEREGPFDGDGAGQDMENESEAAPADTERTIDVEAKDEAGFEEVPLEENKVPGGQMGEAEVDAQETSPKPVPPKRMVVVRSDRPRAVRKRRRR